MHIRYWLLLVGLLYGLPGSVFAAHPEPAGPWQEGTYTGMTTDLPTPQLIVVDVMINKGRIIRIRLRQHPEWAVPEKQKQILRAVISEQTPGVYDSRHDNSEQDRLLDAIEDALNKAHPKPSTAPESQK
jgi:uncharacterized protein with FMN-binding domain